MAGTYAYTITDAKGCTASASVTVLPFVAAKPSIAARVNTATAPAANTILQPQQLSVYPNPSAGAFNLVLPGNGTEKATLQVYSIDNRLMYQTTGNSNGRYTFGSNFMPGMYVVKVQQGTEIQTIKIVKAGN